MCKISFLLGCLTSCKAAFSFFKADFKLIHMFKLILVALYFVVDLPREEDSEDEVLGACPGT